MNGKVIVIGDVFYPDPDGVSVTWVQFYKDKGSFNEQLAEVSAVIKATRGVKPSHMLALISVGAIEHCGQTHSCDLTVEHDPDPITDPRGNPAHCLIKGLPADAEALRELLALEARVMPFS